MLTRVCKFPDSQLQKGQMFHPTFGPFCAWKLMKLSSKNPDSREHQRKTIMGSRHQPPTMPNLGWRPTNKSWPRCSLWPSVAFSLLHRPSLAWSNLQVMSRAVVKSGANRWEISTVTISGWWFGTWLLFFPSYWECHHPNWLSVHHFSEG